MRVGRKCLKQSVLSKTTSPASSIHLLHREGKMSESSSKSSQPLASKQEKDGTEKRGRGRPRKQPPVSPGTALVGSQVGVQIFASVYLPLWAREVPGVLAGETGVEGGARLLLSACVLPTRACVPYAHEPCR